MSRQSHRMAPQYAQHEAEYAAPEGQGDPGEEQGEGGKENRLQDFRSARRHDAPHQRQADDGGQQYQEQQQPTPPARPPGEGVETPAFFHGRYALVHVSVRGVPRSWRRARRSTGFLPSGSKSMNRRQVRFHGRAST